MPSTLLPPDATGNKLSPREFVAWCRFSLCLFGLLCLSFMACLLLAPDIVPTALISSLAERTTILGWLIPLASILVGFYIRRHASRESKDERDLALEARATRYAYRTGGYLFFAAMVAVPFYYGSTFAAHFAPWQTSGLLTGILLFALTVTQAVKNVVLILSYRRGA